VKKGVKPSKKGLWGRGRKRYNQVDRRGMLTGSKMLTEGNRRRSYGGSRRRDGSGIHPWDVEATRHLRRRQRPYGEKKEGKRRDFS